ncbi:MAG: DUF4179 domain-containing protein [Eubacteriales bacterium]|nr:DUF4179 domain-containing protein [Eubacteriales bacterium]
MSKMPRSMEKRILRAVRDSKKPVWRLAARLLAAVFITAALLGMSICVYALNENFRQYINTAAENVRKFLTREEELIDSKAVMIDSSVTDSGVILTVKKAVRDGDVTFLYYSLENTEGEFSGTALVYDTLVLERRVKTNMQNRFRYETVYENRMTQVGLLASDILYLLDGGPVTKVDIILPLNLTKEKTDEYRLTITGLSGVDASGSMSGKDDLIVTRYTQELSVEFKLGDIKEQLSVTEFEPMTEFDIQGRIFTIESMRISPIKIEISIADMTGEEFTFEEYPEYIWEPIDYLTGFWRYWTGNNCEYDKVWNDAKELNKRSYRCFIQYSDSASSDECVAVSWKPLNLYNGRSTVGYIFEPKAPIRPDDIECIYLERVDGLFYGAEGETIVIWEGTR